MAGNDHIFVAGGLNKEGNVSGAAAENAAKTHCIRGHEFTPENTYYSKRDSKNRRRCKACSRNRSKKKPTSGLFGPF